MEMTEEIIWKQIDPFSIIEIIKLNINGEICYNIAIDGMRVYISKDDFTNMLAVCGEANDK